MIDLARSEFIGKIRAHAGTRRGRTKHERWLASASDMDELVEVCTRAAGCPPTRYSVEWDHAVAAWDWRDMRVMVRAWRTTLDCLVLTTGWRHGQEDRERVTLLWRARTPVSSLASMPAHPQSAAISGPEFRAIAASWLRMCRQRGRLRGS